MPVNFLTNEQNINYGKYPEKLTSEQLSKYFYLDERDKKLINACRRDYNKLGYALQLTTLRFLGTFISDLTSTPCTVVTYLSKQLKIDDPKSIELYLERKATCSNHINKIKSEFNYQNFNSVWRFRLTKWLYSQVWLSNDRPSLLFERIVSWLIIRRIILPGISTLEILISKIRERVSQRLWKKLSSLASVDQKDKLENLLLIPPGKRYSKLDELKKGPTRISSKGLVQALKRYQFIRDIGVGKINFGNIPKAKIHHLARYVTISWAPSIARMSENRRLSVLLSFAFVYEIKALDDALDLLDILITEITSQAKRIGEKNRVRNIRDLDKAALKLSDFSDFFVKNENKKNISKLLYKEFSKNTILNAVQVIREIARPSHDKYYDELLSQYKTVRRFLPKLFNTISFISTKEGVLCTKVRNFPRPSSSPFLV